MTGPGQIVILNGAPRSGKSSIARAMQAGFTGIWMNIGVDGAMRQTPERLLPGIGLRPGGERPDLEPHLPGLYGALYEAIAAHSRAGFNVVADLGHHDSYSRPLGILPAMAQRLAGFEVLFVGIRCPLEVNLARRFDSAGQQTYSTDPDIIARWEKAVHDPGIYDLELDTGELTAEACAQRIAAALREKPANPAFTRLAAQG